MSERKDWDGVPLYSRKELADLLERAERLGFDLESGCALEKLTVGQLEALVRGRTEA